MFSRTTGWLFLISAVFGLLLALGCLIGLWVTKSSVTGALTSGMALMGETLDATGETVEVITRALNRAGESLELITLLTDDVAQTVSDSQGLIGSTADLIGKDMTGFVSETQESLTEVEDSARMVDGALSTIDSTLQLIARIPIIGSGLPQAQPSYQPRVPLQESVAEVSRSLDPLVQSFSQIETQLNTSADQAAAIQSEIEQLGQEIAAIETNLTEAKTVTDRYRVIIDDGQQRFERVETRLPVLVNGGYMLLTVVLLWLMMSQVAMLAQALEILRK